jgi:hypothetical protein
MTGAEQRRKRLLVGAGSFADAESGLRLAELLAGRVPADLGGVLVEPRAPAFRSQKLGSAAGLLRDAPNEAEAARAAERDARAFRQKLSVVAKSRTLAWTFDRRTGDLAATLCDAAREWDIVVMGASPLHRAPGRVIWIMAGEADNRTAARDIAEALARSLGSDLVSFSVSVADADETFATEADMLSRINRVNAGVVVIDMATGPLTTPEALRRLIGAARCPVLILGAAKA